MFNTMDIVLLVVLLVVWDTLFCSSDVLVLFMIMTDIVHDRQLTLFNNPDVMLFICIYM